MPIFATPPSSNSRIEDQLPIGEKSFLSLKASSTSPHQLQGEIAKTQQLAPLAIEQNERISQLKSEGSLTHKEVKRVDIFYLYFSVVLLILQGIGQDVESLRNERAMRLKYDLKTLELYREQGNWLLTTSIGCCVLSVIAGALPVLGYVPTAAQTIRDALSKLMTIDPAMKSTILFKSLSQMLTAMARMQEQIGQVHNTFGEGNIHMAKARSDIHRAEADDINNSIHQARELLRSMLDALLQFLREEQEVAQALYR